MGQNIGYIRVSSVDQNTDRQLDGVELQKTFEDKASGKNTDRPQLQECLQYLRELDTLHVHSMDRLARNLIDLQNMVEDLTGRGVSVKFHKENLTFTGENDHMQTLMLQLMGAVAQFERANIRERQLEGIKKAREKGVHLGRKVALSDEQVEEIVRNIEAGEERSEIAKAFGVSRQTLYRTLKRKGLEIKPVGKPVKVVERQELKDAADIIGYILGQHDKGDRAQAIADDLNERGLAQPNGNPWSAMMVGKAVKRLGMF